MHLSRLADHSPSKPAVVMAASGGTTSYRALDDASLRVASYLRHHGMNPGDHVAIMMENRPEFLEIFWGAQRCGLYTTPVNWHLTEREAEYVVRDCGARFLFSSERLSAVAQAIKAADPDLVVVTVGPLQAGMPSYHEEIASRVPRPLGGEVEGSYFYYSSGTTGRPKGITPAHDFPPFGSGLRIDHTMSDAFGFDATAVYLCPAPLYHAAPLGWSLGTTRNGGTVVLMGRFDPLECLAAIERYRVTHAQFVPTMFVRMLKLPSADRRRFDLSSLRLVVHAAAPCPVEVKQRMIDWLGPILLEYYAGSEGVGMTAIDSADWLQHPGSVGRSIRGVLHVLDRDGRELPPGQVGVVYFEAGGEFSYHNDPEKTAAAINERGWATLGDLGYVDQDGYLYLAERRTDLILSGGVNIYPREVEDALILHPAVADVAVIGVPDDEMGERVKAFVQPAEGCGPGTDLQAELAAHCRERLARFKCPAQWEFVAQLPRTEAGKLLRRRLRAAPTPVAPGQSSPV